MNNNCTYLRIDIPHIPMSLLEAVFRLKFWLFSNQLLYHISAQLDSSENKATGHFACR